ncbi:AAA-like domain-containing protein [Capilliphycus salinus ALCB114379]|uniref:AAA-like domain-containing protein n=1 Tax=Capilliphycus salinus TaxID=2768948 RepID=UPI0039A628FE
MSQDLNSTYEYQVGGGLSTSAPSYVIRQADDQLYEGLKAGKFCYVLNSRQMGKSSLRVRTMKRLEAENIQCAAIDLSQIRSQDVTPEKWYKGVFYELVNKLNLETKINRNTWWNQLEDLPVSQRIYRFFREILFLNCSHKIVILFDEIDSLLSFDFSLEDFFILIRSCYENRAEDANFYRLNFALFGVTSPSELIVNKTQTPFNIGQAIELNGFQPTEVQPLAAGLVGYHQNPEKLLDKILFWTGGQPFITQKLCQLIRTSNFALDRGKNPIESVDELVRTRIIEQWEIHDEPEHLKTIRDRILFNEQRAGRLLGLYQKILQQGEILAEGTPEQLELCLSGLVKRHQGKLKVFNPIYAEIFNQNWVQQSLSNLRPYAENFLQWKRSNGEDKSRLLRGQALQEALAWAKDKSLSEEDFKFLSESQTWDKLEIETTLKSIQLALKLEQEFTRKQREETEALNSSIRHIGDWMSLILQGNYHQILQKLDRIETGTEGILTTIISLVRQLIKAMRQREEYLRTTPTPRSKQEGEISGEVTSTPRSLPPRNSQRNSRSDPLNEEIENNQTDLQRELNELVNSDYIQMIQQRAKAYHDS